MKKSTKVGLSIAGIAAVVTGVVLAKRYIDNQCFDEDDYVDDDDPEFYDEYDVLSEEDFSDSGEDEIETKQSIKKPAVNKVVSKSNYSNKNNGAKLKNATKNTAVKQTKPKTSAKVSSAKVAS